MVRILSTLFCLCSLVACDLESAPIGETDETGDESSETGEEEEASATASSSTNQSVQTTDRTPEEQESDTPDTDESKSEADDPTLDDPTLDDPTLDDPTVDDPTVEPSDDPTVEPPDDPTVEPPDDPTEDETGDPTEDDPIEPDLDCYWDCWIAVDQEFADMQRACRDLTSCAAETCVRKTWNFKYHASADCSEDCHYPPPSGDTERCYAACSDEEIECLEGTCNRLDCINANRICRGGCQ